MSELAVGAVATDPVSTVQAEPKFIDAYLPDGRVQRVPADWRNHPALWDGFSTTPPAAAEPDNHSAPAGAEGKKK